MLLNDIGIALQILGFALMLSKLGESLFFEIYFIKNYGIRWRKKAWEKTPDLKKHTMGVLTLWGKQVPALEVKQANYYFSHSKVPDQIHWVGIIFIIIGLTLHFSVFNPENS